MAEKEKLTCQNPNHPFKQKWYYYEEVEGETQAAYLNNRKYCTSCSSYFNFLRMLMTAAMSPMQTLYGNGMIKASKAQLKRIIDDL